jgi:putative endonuclease
MSCWLYILESEANRRFYVGISTNPERRLKHHNTTETGFTARYRPWRLVFSQQFDSEREARTAERKIKDWKRRKMTRLVIEGTIEL